MDFSEYTNTDIPSIVKTFLVDPAFGLKPTEVESRRKEHGLNRLAESKIHPWKIFLRQFKSSFIYLLLGAAVLSFLLGEIIEGWMIVLFILINTSLGFYQEYQSEKTVELLKRYIATKVKVRRDGAVSTIDASDLVPGDIVVIEAGDSIPADIRIIEDMNLTVNEEPLTGESVPVKKESSPLTYAATELYEAKNIGFSGTTIVSGRGLGIVFAIGTRTMLGDIARLAGMATRESKFEQELGKFSKFILYLVVTTLGLIFIANLLIKGWDANIASLAIFSVALAVSVVPEALPVVMTFSLSRGARRLAKNHVVVKRLSSIEDLGSIQVLCTDKTGTITENKLTVHTTCSANAEKPIDEIIFAANMGGSYLSLRARGTNPDPFDVALWEALTEDDQARLATYRPIEDIPFDPVRKKNSVLLEHNGATLLIVRGATEAILDASSMSDEEQNRVASWVADEGRAGRRTLAVASKVISSNDYDNVQDETDLTFIGCVSFIDPIKESAREAIKQAMNLKVGIKILTGDSREVAGTVAFEVGLAKTQSEAMTAHELFALNDTERDETLERVNVFARVSPEEKYRIIELLQKKYQVGFLGEGINDAPALKLANVAIVVDSASNIAREAADIILLEKGLDVVVGGIREGRAIFANTIKYIKSSLSSNFGNFYAVAISSLFIPFLPMLPLQILLVNLLSDFPAIAIATDTVDAEELNDPKQYNIRKIIMFGTTLGIVSTVFDFITFASFYKVSAEALQTHWFMVSILTEILFLYSIRSNKFFLKAKAPSAPLMLLSLFAIVSTITIPFTEFGHTFFHFISPTAQSLGFVLGIVVAFFIATETAKLLYYRLAQPSAQN
ncbi:MAG TPA: cation-transporting ATPase [Candidatus Yonathbacteria bacterium]|nr:cation-transporting ATPase [Candidatus Yonathbacteria bacterium]